MYINQSFELIGKKVIVGSALLALLLTLFHVQGAFAHAMLIKSDPPRRATYSVSPKQIQLWFNEKVEGAYASIVVRDTNKNVVTENSPEIIPDDPKSIILKLPEMESGRYTVHYRVMSVDGHVIESNYDFNVKLKTH